jgi:hypothetical protein
MLFEDSRAFGFAALLLSAGLQLTGASAGLALGVAAA